MMMPRLLILFIAVPLIDLALLFWIARHIGGWETVTLVIVTGFVGAALARSEGVKTLLQIQRDMAEGRMPTESLVQGGMILVAGTLLVTPGVLTDAVGLLFLIPVTRRVAARYLMTTLSRGLTITPISTNPGPTADAPRRYVASRTRRVDPPTGSEAGSTG